MDITELQALGAKYGVVWQYLPGAPADPAAPEVALSTAKADFAAKFGVRADLLPDAAFQNAGGEA